MAKKEISGFVKLQCPGGQATPAPPIGPALGQHGVNIAQFVSQFNERTKDQPGLILPVIMTVYKDRTFEFIIKSPPASVLIKKAAKVAKGSGVPNKEKVGSITMEQVQEIVDLKKEDLNSHTDEAAQKMIMGTALSMGITIRS